MRETSSLPLKTLLLSFSVSNLGFGLLVEPFYIGLLIKLLQRDNLSEVACLLYLVICCFFAAASFLRVMALSTDRFLAVHLHLRYQELMTQNRAVAVVVRLNMGVQCICFTSFRLREYS